MHLLVSRLFIYFVFFFLSNSVLAQTTTKTNSQEIEEMLIQLKKTKSEKEKLDVFGELASLFRQTNTNLAIVYSDSTILLAEKYHNIKQYWYGLNSKAEALRCSGNLEGALKIHFTALKHAEKNNLILHQAHSLNNIGLILKRQKNVKDAKDYISKSRQLYKSIHDTDGIITTSVNLGNCMMRDENYNGAISYYNEVIVLAEPRSDLSSLGDGYTNIGHCYYNMNLPLKAKEFYYKGLICREKIGVPSTIADSYSNYGYMLYEEGDFKSANDYYQKALAFTRPTGDKDNLIDLFTYLKEMSVAKKDFEQAYYYSDSVRIYKDSVINETNIASLNEMSQKFESEKKQMQIENLDKENSLKEKENKQQKLFLIIVGAALIISIVLGIFVLKQYKEKKEANHVILEQKETLQEKQKEIIDSITYAKHLQEAILPTEELIKEHLPQSFILYKPKDIVAGDFYWLEHHEDLIFVAAADCTGHGVPGAMVSVVCSNALNRAVKEFYITEPGKILNKTRDLVLETFARSNKNIKDGMDISLCCINKTTHQLMWSGANNPLWYIENNEIIEITADKQPIGKVDNPNDFTTHNIQLHTGNTIYLFTDGYADQFGGPKGKKMKYKPFKELLLRNCLLSMNEQKHLLEKKFEDWKGNLEQVDDVCVIGIHI